MNLLLQADSYKTTHPPLYPDGMTGMYSYLESRGGAFPATVFFGLQYYLRQYLAGGISIADVEEAEGFYAEHFGRSDCFDAAMWKRMVQKHDGAIPLLITAVPEGSLIPTSNVLMTVENTDPEFPFVASFFETLLLKVWYPSTVATLSHTIHSNIRAYYRHCGANMSSLDFACHDFGYRGVSSEESAGLGAAAHLLSFKGTDTIAGIRMLQDHYQGGMAGFSVPATEHNVIIAYGRDHEVDAFRRVLERYPTGTVACVSDTYDIFNAVENLWGGELRDLVLARNGRLVIRPDSGDPMTVVPRVLEILGTRFPVTINERGYRLLDPHVRVIQGDGMDLHSIDKLYGVIVREGWSPENLVVGSGGGLLQSSNRDTCQFAFKASEVVVDGRVRPISKNPVTDPSKQSKAGRLALVKRNGVYQTVREHLASEPVADNLLEPVFADGEMLRTQTLDEIRSILAAGSTSDDLLSRRVG